MSHISRGQTTLTNIQYAAQALQRMGYQPEVAPDGQNTLTVYNYRGFKIATACVTFTFAEGLNERQNCGLQMQPDGTLHFVADFDGSEWSYWSIRKRQSEPLEHVLGMNYAYCAATDLLATQGFVLESEQQIGDDLHLLMTREA